MKCITDKEFEAWLATFGARLNDNNVLGFSSPSAEAHIMLASPPNSVMGLPAFAGWLSTWLPLDRQQALWLRGWRTYPPEQVILFESLRRGFGEPRGLREAACHMFNIGRYEDEEKRTEIQITQEAQLKGLNLYVMQFDWEAYLIAQDNMEFISFSDECVMFYSADIKRLAHARDWLVRADCHIEWVKPAL